jgi:hypothetical protein
MIKPRLVVKPSSLKTRLLVTYGDEEVMRAQLPPPTAVHPRAAATLCEGLSLWLDRPLSIVLCADAPGTSFALGLCDGFGFGVTSVHYEVEVVDPRHRVRGLGSFRDLRRLQLRGVQ